MSNHSSTSSAGSGRISHHATTRSSAPRYMSERQLESYLLARETLRRVQQTARVADVMHQRTPTSSRSAHRDRFHPH